ncbi:hypothetical protein OGATHE_001194 [Ogataea polymorpha]|uniref:Uncharacterized protein n=1 Tax=Ogataea polymorpha TaxID=460523 RepID=A0A9P8PS76_9ASCO|nr:hypothetical protein OGATHE_001194 [Ogataea polymorpha]
MEEALEFSSGRSTSTSGGSWFLSSKFTNRLSFSSTSTLTVRFWVCWSTIDMIFCLASSQLSTSPSTTTLARLEKMSASSAASLLPVLAISILTPVDSRIGFNVLPCEPITVDMSLNGMPNSIFTGLAALILEMILKRSFFDTGSCSAASTINVSWVLDDLTAGLKVDGVFDEKVRPLDMDGPHWAGADPIDTPRAGKYVSSSIDTFLSWLDATESTSTSSSYVVGSEAVDDGAEDSVAEIRGVSGSSETDLCFCARSSAGLGILTGGVFLKEAPK